MKTLVEVTRLVYLPECTLGELVVSVSGIQRGPKLATLERPWAENRAQVSCIPTGCYLIRRDTFQGRYPNFAVLDVPGRSAIEMHVANRPEELQGCLAIGVSHWFKGGGVAFSKQGFGEFMQAMGDVEDAVLVIRDLKGGTA